VRGQKVRWNTLLSGLGLTLVVVAGVGLGRAGGHPGDPPHVFTHLGLIALILLVVGVVSALRSDSPRRTRLTGAWLSGIAVVYCAAVMVAEPFLDPPWDASGVLVVATWVAPLVIAGVVLVRVRCWWGVAGVGVFLLTCVWLVTLNMHMRDLSGFLTRIRT
jgi:hypothetical protein